MPGIHQDGGIGVFLRMKKGIQKDCGSNRYLFLKLFYTKLIALGHILMSPGQGISNVHVCRGNFFIIPYQQRFCLQWLGGNGEEERKIHALAFENFQRTNGMNEIGKNQRKTI